MPRHLEGLQVYYWVILQLEAFLCMCNPKNATSLYKLSSGSSQLCAWNFFFLNELIKYNSWHGGDDSSIG